MVTKSSLTFVIVVAVLVSGEASASAMVMKKPAEKSAPQLSHAFHWYDGKDKKTVWLDPELTVEFDPIPSGEAAVKQAYPNAEKMESRQAGVRIWKLQPGADSRSAASQLKAGNPSGRYSPVFRDSPSDSGRKRALPGGVIVYLNPSWDEAAVKSWAVSHNLMILDKLEIGPNVYVIQTDPGLASLETANALFESGDVVSAAPNWWQEAVTR
jgi:hypothetical protein